MTNLVMLDIKENDIEVFNKVNDIIISSTDGDTEIRVVLTINQLDKLYADAMKLYGEPTRR